jgi:excisionase family DNA binding protein
VSQVSERLALSRSSVYRLLSSGVIPAVQLGGPGSSLRVPEHELEAWVYANAGDAMAPAIPARLGTATSKAMPQSSPKCSAGEQR